MDFAKLKSVWEDLLIVVSHIDDFKQEWDHIQAIIDDIKTRVAANDAADK
jgi:hypothetical protein